MRLFVYGSLTIPVVQKVLMLEECPMCPYILKGYQMYEDAESKEYYLSEANFGFLRGEILEVPTEKMVYVEMFMKGYTKVLNEDDIILFTRVHKEQDSEVPWGKQESYVCDIEELEERAHACFDIPRIKKISLTNFGSFSAAVEVCKTCLAH